MLSRVRVMERRSGASVLMEAAFQRRWGWRASGRASVQPPCSAPGVGEQLVGAQPGLVVVGAARDDDLVDARGLDEAGEAVAYLVRRADERDPRHLRDGLALGRRPLRHEAVDVALRLRQAGAASGDDA